MRSSLSKPCVHLNESKSASVLRQEQVDECQSQTRMTDVKNEKTKKQERVKNVEQTNKRRRNKQRHQMMRRHEVEIPFSQSESTSHKNQNNKKANFEL